MIQYFLASTFILSPLYPDDTPEAKRVEVLSKYFDPQPGKSPAVVETYERVKNKKNPLKAKGYIWVRPPKGHCFIITREMDHMDKAICEPTRLSFDLSDISLSGKIHWLVSQSEADEGTKLTWQTPYRIANYIPLGMFEQAANERHPIYSCEAIRSGTNRKIILTFFDDRKWYIPFPDYDTQVAGKKADKNLFVRVMTTNKDGKPEASDASSEDEDNRITAEDVKRKHKILAMKLSGKYKEKKKKEYSFLVRPWEAYEMNSAHVMEVGGPLGLNGKCRYKFSGAKFDEHSGVVECFNSDSYDALFAHLTCSSELPIRPKP